VSENDGGWYFKKKKNFLKVCFLKIPSNLVVCITSLALFEESILFLLILFKITGIIR